MASDKIGQRDVFGLRFGSDFVPVPARLTVSTTYWILALPIPYFRVFVVINSTALDDEDGS